MEKVNDSKQQGDLDPQSTSSRAESPLLPYAVYISATSFWITAPETTIAGRDIRVQDVLLGKSRSLSHFGGNELLREEVSQYYESYKKASKSGKTTIAWQIFNTVVKAGGRFLKCSSDETRPPEATSWVVAGDEEGREKVSVVFRNMTKQKKRKRTDEESVDNLEESTAKKKQSK